MSVSQRSTLDTFQRLLYAAGDNPKVIGRAVRLVATMNADTLIQLGREVAMGGVVAQLGLPAACEEAAKKGDGPTGIFLWDVEIALEGQLGDSEIRMDELSVH